MKIVKRLLIATLIVILCIVAFFALPYIIAVVFMLLAVLSAFITIFFKRW